MSTWDENKALINGLWPQHEFTPEEGELFRGDLAPLDQDTLADAIRNTKRNHDTAWVHLKWIVDEYRELLRAKRRVKHVSHREEKLKLNVIDDENRRLCDQFVALIDISEPGDFESIQTKVLDSHMKLHADSAIRVIGYARKRLLGQEQTFGRVTRSGDITPIKIGPRVRNAN
jgi:hypothetical protein